ncbi:hypothetical protein M3Y99_00908600 [Aphelenchoides fujianensis]|nr:hypothetical protein M3Y99_00908600 [Aphelenchoides fujianensis]
MEPPKNPMREMMLASIVLGPNPGAKLMARKSVGDSGRSGEKTPPVAGVEAVVKRKSGETSSGPNRKKARSSNHEEVSENPEDKVDGESDEKVENTTSTTAPAAVASFRDDRELGFTCELTMKDFEPTDVRVVHWARLLIVEARKRVLGAVMSHERYERYECRLPMAVEWRVFKAKWTNGRLEIVAQPEVLSADADYEQEIPIEIDNPQPARRQT